MKRGALSRGVVAAIRRIQAFAGKAEESPRTGRTWAFRQRGQRAPEPSRVVTNLPGQGTPLGLPRSSRLLIVVALVDSLGTGLFLSGSAVFFTRSAGLSTTEVGVGLTAGGLCALLTLTPLGMLADRIGPRAAAVLMHFWRAIGFVGYAFVHDFVGFMLIACLVMPPTRAIEPIGQMFVDRAVGAELRIRVMA